MLIFNVRTTKFYIMINESLIISDIGDIIVDENNLYECNLKSMINGIQGIGVIYNGEIGYFNFYPYGDLSLMDKIDIMEYFLKRGFILDSKICILRELSENSKVIFLKSDSGIHGITFCF